MRWLAGWKMLKNTHMCCAHNVTNYANYKIIKVALRGKDGPAKHTGLRRACVMDLSSSEVILNAKV
jgi:hypothetical protein